MNNKFSFECAMSRDFGGRELKRIILRATVERCQEQDG